MQTSAAQTARTLRFMIVPSDCLGWSTPRLHVLCRTLLPAFSHLADSLARLSPRRLVASHAGCDAVCTTFAPALRLSAPQHRWVRSLPPTCRSARWAYRLSRSMLALTVEAFSCSPASASSLVRRGCDGSLILESRLHRRSANALRSGPADCSRPRRRPPKRTLGAFSSAWRLAFDPRFHSSSGSCCWCTLSCRPLFRGLDRVSASRSRRCRPHVHACQQRRGE